MKDATQQHDLSGLAKVLFLPRFTGQALYDHDRIYVGAPGETAGKNVPFDLPFTMDTAPSSLIRDISPPPKRRKVSETPGITSRTVSEPTLAAVEAGKAKVEDHLAYFTEHLCAASRSTPQDIPRLSIKNFADLYRSNQNEHGNHFVVHQHNHPRAGVHYDLRLQFSKTSSISFALPKGLPGNPNSKSLGRMAIETRVHNFWNHLIESASYKTGSLLIWDTGTYTVLPRKIKNDQPDPQTTDCDSDSDPMTKPPSTTPKRDSKHENSKLVEAFQTRYIRLRLHGTRLPKDYTVTLRLPSTNDIQNPKPLHHLRRKRRKASNQPTPKPQRQNTTDSEEESSTPSAPQKPIKSEETAENLDTDSEEDISTRIHNAYPGSNNTVGSIHQRKWFLTLDRRSSGFRPGNSGIWERDGEAGFETFFVRGRDFERSVVTGRLAREVENDEGCEGFVGRAGWTAIFN